VTVAREIYNKSIVIDVIISTGVREGGLEEEEQKLKHTTSKR
jgi:hypothetical protein